MHHINKIVFTALVAFSLSGCTWFTVEEYVTLTVNNKTSETLIIDTGESLITFRVASQSIGTSRAVKSMSLNSYGEATGKHYGSRVFTSDGEVWTIYD